MTLIAIGCQSTPKTTFSTERPSLHSVATGHFVINSDVRLDQDNVLVKELEELHDQVYDTLQLPEQRDPVHVYLFSDEASYRFYMHTTWKDLPPRRAYFVGTARERAVYSFISPQVKEDLRHEFTHGLLHATLQSVPLWLDEGLAEYFEVDASTPGAAHASHLRELRMAESEKWNPNLYRLEMLTDFRDLTTRDYAESWAWVHFMLNDSEESAKVLLDYLTVLRSTKTPKRLMPVLEAAVPSYFNGMQTHVLKLFLNVAPGFGGHQREGRQAATVDVVLDRSQPDADKSSEGGPDIDWWLQLTDRFRVLVKVSNHDPETTESASGPNGT